MDCIIVVIVSVDYTKLWNCVPFSSFIDIKKHVFKYIVKQLVFICLVLEIMDISFECFNVFKYGVKYLVFVCVC